MERKLIGAGRTSEVYEYGDDCILKLFTDELNDHRLKAVGFVAAESRIEAKAS
jgi:hypothetical protein